MSALERARKLADAVLYEGYLLYPYRASTAKQRVRWQFGVLVPPAFTETSEAHGSRTECLLEAAGDAVLHLRPRFLHVLAKSVEPPGLTVNGVEYQDFDEAAPEEFDVVLPLADLLDAERVVPLHAAGGRVTEPVGDGRVTRERWPVEAALRASAERLPGPYGAIKLTLLLDNVTGWTGTDRAEALRRSLVAAHTLVAVTGGVFLSMTDPPEWAKPAAGQCRNEGTWPVLIEEGLLLSTPIILADRPRIAPESPGDLFDATEIDEILSLRTLTLTDEEKREVRGTDPRAAELLDRVENMRPELIERLHGAIRSAGPRRGWDEPAPVFETDAPWWDPGADASVSPETDSVVVAGRPVARGSRVRLHPAGRSDAQDMFVAGRAAVVEAVLLDVDGSHHLAVILEDDPGADIRREQGRFLYFAPEEVEPL